MPAELTVVAPTFNERRNVRPLVRLLRAALDGVDWRLILVDDDSPDGTARLAKRMAQVDSRIQCIRRVGRRGLAGAVAEGALAASTPYVAVIDADLQHDETLLPLMLQRLRAGEADMVVASRYVAEGKATGGLSPVRAAGSRVANWLGNRILRGARVTDPVSGFFMARREVFEQVAPRLSVEGFKILFDIIASTRTPLRILELPYEFRERSHGDSKLDNRVVADYLGLLLSKATNDLISPRALMFGAVGASGLVVNLAVLKLLRLAGVDFSLAQGLGALVAMTSNYLLNNVLTYRDRRKKGWALLGGYVRFCLLCSIGLMANVAVATLVNTLFPGNELLASAIGAIFGAVWNYVTTSFIVW